MIKFTLLALLVLIHSSTSSKRLLLQGVGAPPASNPGVGVPPVDPAANPGVGAPPVDPATNPGGASPPANPGNGGAAPPANGGGGAAQPPVNNGPGIALPPGYIPPPPGQGIDPAFLPPQFQPPTFEAVCGAPYGMPGSCAYRNTLQLQLQPGQAGACQPGAQCGPLEYNNVANNFKMYCNGYASCYGTETNINVGGAMNVPMGVRKLEQVGCSEPFSCMHGTLNIRNNQNNGHEIEVANLEFKDVGAGNDFTINLWGAKVNDVNCDRGDYCANCWIQNFRLGCNNPNNPLCLIEKKPCFGY